MTTCDMCQKKQATRREIGVKPGNTYTRDLCDECANLMSSDIARVLLARVSPQCIDQRFVDMIVKGPQ